MTDCLEIHIEFVGELARKKRKVLKINIERRKTAKDYCDEMNYLGLEPSIRISVSVYITKFASFF